MEVMTEAIGVTMFVASSRPPSPVSQMTKSTAASAKAIRATTVVNSKKVGCKSAGIFCRSSETKRASVVSGNGCLPTWMRSPKRTRCGEV